MESPEILNITFTDLKLKGKNLANEQNKPTLKQLGEYKESVLSFIKRKKRIVYGGTAIHYALMLATNGKEGLYSGVGEIDYDFYTPDPIGDSIDLCNELFDKGFPYVKRNLALSGTTYRIQVNTNIEIADVSYCPEWLFDKLPVLETEAGIKFIHPDMLRLDMYKAMGHLPHDFYRWEKDYTRLMLLEQHYPMRSFRLADSKEYTKAELPRKSSTLIDTVINDYVLKNQKTTLVTGDYAYNYYISIIPRGTNKVGGAGSGDYSGKLVTTQISLLSIIVTDYDHALQGIKDTLKEYSDHVTVTEQGALLKIIGKSAFINYKNSPIIFIQLARTQVVPYIKIRHNEGTSIKITDYFGTLAFYHIMKIIDSIENDEYTGRIVDLKIAESKYTSAHKEFTIIDPKNPFQLIMLDGMETNANTSEPHFKFSGKVLYIPEVSKIKPDYEKNKEYYRTVVDPEIGGGARPHDPPAKQ
jgi:hypothetical protein